MAAAWTLLAAKFGCVWLVRKRKQIPSPPQPYEKIPYIHFACSVSWSNCVSIQPSILVFCLVFYFLEFMFDCISLHCLLLPMSMSCIWVLWPQHWINTTTTTTTTQIGYQLPNRLTRESNKTRHSLPSPPKARINSAPMLDNQANWREREECRQKGDKTEYRGTRRQLADVTWPEAPLAHAWLTQDWLTSFPPQYRKCVKRDVIVALLIKTPQTVSIQRRRKQREKQEQIHSKTK